MTLRNTGLARESPLVTPLPRVLRPQRAVPADAVRPTRAEINLANLRHNLHVIERHVQGVPVWGVLKADGYGHGAKAVARTLERAGIRGLCVALVEEGVELREAGIRCPILIMGGYYGRAWGELIRYRLTPVVHDTWQIQALAEEVRFAGADPIHVHVKIDTGMARLGALPGEVQRIGQALGQHREVVLGGLMTHFSCADDGDSESMNEQMARFDRVHRDLAALGLVVPARHAANSAALLRDPRTWLDMVRPGIALFGVEPYAGAAPELRPVMRVRSEIVAVRELPSGTPVGYGASWKASRPSRIATVPLGYADGLSRALSNRGKVLIRGQKAPVVGTISMDMTMVDVTDVPGANVGDECLMLGTQKGPHGEVTLCATEIAKELGTIPWEVLTAVSRRVPRFYREP
jgi:alanine racemase